MDAGGYVKPAALLPCGSMALLLSTPVPLTLPAPSLSASCMIPTLLPLEPEFVVLLDVKLLSLLSGARSVVGKVFDFAKPVQAILENQLSTNVHMCN